MRTGVNSALPPRSPQLPVSTNTFSLKYIQTTAFPNLYNNSLRGSAQEWRPSSKASRRAPSSCRLRCIRGGAERRTGLQTGPPRCAHLSFTRRSGYVRGQGENQPFRRGGKLRSGGRRNGSARTWRTEPWRPRRGERHPSAKQK